MKKEIYHSNIAGLRSTFESTVFEDQRSGHAFDAIAAGENAIPVLGSTLRDKSKLFQAIALNDTPVYLAFDEDAEKKTGQIIRNMLYYDIELYKIDTSGFEDIAEMPLRTFLSRKQMAQAIDHDDYFLMDELRRIM